jgi:hypothetical protein
MQGNATLSAMQAEDKPEVPQLTVDQVSTFVGTALAVGKLDPEEFGVVHEFLLRSSLSYFAAHALGMDTGSFYFAISEGLSDTKRLAVQAARDTGKSSLFSYAFPIWMAWKYPGSLGYIFSSTYGLACDLLAILKDGNRQIDPVTGDQMGLHALADVPTLAWMVDEKACKWSKDEIVLTNGSRIRARGWDRGATRGPHPLYVVCDDVLKDSSLWSAIEREKATMFLRTAVTNMVLRGGWIIVVGTPFHEDDLYGWVKKNSAYTFMKFPGIMEIRPGDADYDEELGGDVQHRSLVPHRHTVEELLAKKEEIGSIAFAREILCEPITDDLTLFPSHLFAGDVMAHHCPWQPSLLQIHALGWETYLGVDIAESADVGADYFVVTVIALDLHGNRYVIDSYRDKGVGFQQQLSIIKDLAVKYRPALIYVEANAMQRVWSEELIRTTALPIRPFHVGNNKNRLSVGVPSLRVLFENEKLRLARSTPEAIIATDIYISELKRFGWFQGKLQGAGSHDDCVMSLWIAIEATRDAAFKWYMPGQDDLGELSREVVNAEDETEMVNAAIRLVLSGGEVTCGSEHYRLLRDALESYALRSVDIHKQRFLYAEIARLDDEFGDDDDLGMAVLTA